MKRPPTFGRSVGVTLRGEDNQVLWIPQGFAHGFVVVSESADFLYKTTDYWYPQHERTLLWSDPQIAVRWPLAVAPLVNAKDAGGLLLDAAETYP